MKINLNHDLIKSIEVNDIEEVMYILDYLAEKMKPIEEIIWPSPYPTIEPFKSPSNGNPFPWTQITYFDGADELPLSKDDLIQRLNYLSSNIYKA